MKFTRITKAVALGGAVAMLASIAACVLGFHIAPYREGLRKSQSEYQGKGH